MQRRGFPLPAPPKQIQSGEAAHEERGRTRKHYGSEGEASVCTEDDPIYVIAEPGRSTVTGRVEE